MNLYSEIKSVTDWQSQRIKAQIQKNKELLLHWVIKAKRKKHSNSHVRNATNRKIFWETVKPIFGYDIKTRKNKTRGWRYKHYSRRERIG